MAEPIFPIENFRLLFPEFITIPDENVLAQSEMALCFLTSRGCSCSEQMWLLLTAHLLMIAAQIAGGGGGVSGAPTSASIGKISVSFAAPASTSDWSHWLSLTPYGQQFTALNRACNTASYVGGRGERSGFRVVRGKFPRG